MDPQATWNDLLAALAAQDLPAAQELAASLSEWLRRGGFPPLTLPDIPNGDSLHHLIAHAVCDHVLRSTNTASKRR